MKSEFIISIEDFLKTLMFNLYKSRVFVENDRNPNKIAKPKRKGEESRNCCIKELKFVGM